MLALGVRILASSFFSSSETEIQPSFSTFSLEPNVIEQFFSF